MKRLLVFILISFIILTNICYAEPSHISAKSAVVMDVESGRVLYEKNMSQKLSMASTTKIMTAIVAMENSNLDEVIKTSSNAAYTEGSSIWLDENETIKMKDALYGLLLSSGNDVAVAIAEHVGGSVEKFAQMMNKTAKKIGALNTNFKNPHGLTAKNHYTTAFDLALITSYALKKPLFKKIVKTKRKKIPWKGHSWDRSLRNHNKLLWKYEYADGVKTGYTKKAGRCLVSSATKDEKQFVAVTLNAGDDWNDHIKMLNYAFKNYKLKTIVDKNQFMKTVVVENARENKVSLVADKEVKILVNKNKKENVKIKYNVPDSLNAPVIKGEKVGNIEVYIKDQKMASVSLSPSKYIEEVNLYNDINKVLKNWLLIFNDNESPVVL